MSIADQLNAIVKDAGGAGGMPIPGLTLARVTNVTDDNKFNRVKCLPLGKGNDQEETDWCYVMAPMGGKDCGTFFFPQVDDLVVLAYLQNDVHSPLVLGAVWNTETTPPYTIADGKVLDYSIRTPKKIELVFHDEDDKQSAALTMPSGSTIRVDDEKKSISVQDKDGKNALLMNLDKGEIALKADKKLTLSAGDTTITLESSGKVTIKGSGDISVESGANLKLKGTPKVSAQATSVEIKADAQLKLQGAQASVKADATLDLNASGPATLKGAIVKIN